MKVVKCEPLQEAKICEIGNSLEEMQAVVGGWIEACYPFDDEVAIVCNEEGKLNGSQPCRVLRFNDGTIADVIFGTFFICGLSKDNFGSLSDEMAEKYLRMFEKAEVICL